MNYIAIDDFCFNINTQPDGPSYVLKHYNLILKSDIDPHVKIMMNNSNLVG